MYSKKAQLKIPYQEYLLIYSRQLLAQMSSEEKQHLADQIQARVVLNGEKPVNQEVYQSVMDKINGGNDERSH